MKACLPLAEETASKPRKNDGFAVLFAAKLGFAGVVPHFSRGYAADPMDMGSGVAANLFFDNIGKAQLSRT